jgi:hypothetical protein
LYRFRKKALSITAIGFLLSEFSFGETTIARMIKADKRTIEAIKYLFNKNARLYLNLSAILLN